jgi:hypothetical protein
LEKEQTIKNSSTFSVEVLAGCGTIVAVYGSGDIVLMDYRDNKLRELIGELSKQAFYSGCYWVVAHGQRRVFSVDQVFEILNKDIIVYSQLWFDNLRFLLSATIMYQLIPKQFPSQIEGCKSMRAGSLDNRKIKRLCLFQQPLDKITI